MRASQEDVRQLFYKKDYKSIIQILQDIHDPSIQDMHNTALSKYLMTGENEVDELIKLINSIKSDPAFAGEWPNHPSYPLLNYNLSLLYLRNSKYQQCLEIIKNLWDNSEKIDKLVLLCTSLVTIEIAVRTGEKEYVEKAFSFLNSNFPNAESITTLLSSKNVEGQTAQQIFQGVQYAKLRYNVSEIIRKPHDESNKSDLESVLSNAEITPDAKNRPVIPVLKALPLACACLHLGDQMKYQTVLESADDPGNYAILNDRGIFELLQGRYSSALLHFTKSLNSRPSADLIFPFHQVAYNLGLSLLMKHKPKAAFGFFHAVIPMMPRSPFLWLRLAESVAMYYKRRVAKIRARTQQSAVVARKLVTASRTFYLLPMSNLKIFESESSSRPADLSLDFGERCARNAIALCGERHAGVRRAAELLCAFLALELGDGQRAVDMGRNASEARGDLHSALLGRLYTMQGFLQMGETEEARSIMSKLLLETVMQKEKEASDPHALTFVNVAMAAGDIQKAEQKLQKVAEQGKHRPDVVLTSIAFELQRRRFGKATAILKEYQSAQSPERTQ